MFKDLIEYEVLHEACEECFGFVDVTFKRDFGPWKIGQKVEALWFNLEKSVVEELTHDGRTLNICKFQLTAHA